MALFQSKEETRRFYNKIARVYDLLASQTKLAERTRTMHGDADEIVVVYTTDDLYEAEIIRNELQDAGIACELDGESQGGFTEIVETKLLVHAWDFDRARRLIEERQGDTFEPPGDERPR